MQHKKYNRIIVFDIDGTLCTRLHNKKMHDLAQKFHPECDFWCWDLAKITEIKSADLKRYRSMSDKFYFMIPPYMDVLFRYLVDHDVRVVFFSSGVVERNVDIVEYMMTKYFGPKRYRELKKHGQFEVFSRHHLIPSVRRKGKCDIDDDKSLSEHEKAVAIHKANCEGNNIKDLDLVIKAGEEIDNMILVEDDPSYTKYEQAPALRVIDLSCWSIYEDHKEGEFEYYKNTAYHLIGMFKELFENDKYKNLQLRPALKQFVIDYGGEFQPPQHGYLDRSQYESFFEYYDNEDTLKKSIAIGIAEVRKTYKDARIYNMSRY